MKIELIENKVYFNNGSEKKEIHPFWLRERANGEEYLDKGTQQRLFDPTFLSNNICLLYTSPSPRDLSTSRMPSSA